MKGCRDNGCIFLTPRQGTNGGCRCLEGLSLERRLYIEQNVKEMKAEIKELRGYLNAVNKLTQQDTKERQRESGRENHS